MRSSRKKSDWRPSKIKPTACRIKRTWFLGRLHLTLQMCVYFFKWRTNISDAQHILAVKAAPMKFYRTTNIPNLVFGERFFLTGHASFLPWDAFSFLRIFFGFLVCCDEREPLWFLPPKTTRREMTTQACTDQGEPARRRRSIFPPTHVDKEGSYHIGLKVQAWNFAQRSLTSTQQPLKFPCFPCIAW